MTWHKLEPHHEYRVSDIIELLMRDLETGRVKDVKGKMPLIELFEEKRHEVAVYTPFGASWGTSPYNPNAWKTPEGEDLIEGYRQPRMRTRFSQSVRKSVSDKTNGHCYSCGKRFSDLSEIWIEHIIPFSIGGSDEIHNLLPGCRICNYARQNFTPHQIQRILSIGSVIVREIDKESDAGKSIHEFLEGEEERRKQKRKHKDCSFLVFQPERKQSVGLGASPRR